MALTEREITVLRFILQGKSNKEIAHVLHRSVRTVEVHRSHIMRKLDADNVVDLVKRATAMGIQQADSEE
jgi:two-component system response regulator TtrR